MKQFLSVLLLLVAIIAVHASLKESQKAKHEQDKNYKKGNFGHPKSKAEIHAVKEVLKHAPHTIGHHEAELQVDLSHSSGKKQLHTGPSSHKDQDLKLQDLTVEDKIHHKIQAHKLHRDTNHSPPNYNGRQRNTNVNKMTAAAAVVHGHHLKPAPVVPLQQHGGNRYNNNNNKKQLEKKNPKKILNLSKNKKYKRAKRLHKFVW